VTGAGSVWLNQSDFHVGSFGHQNQLIVSAGGRLDNDFGYVGVNFSAQDNEVLITDSGSVWSNDNGLVVGRTASGNRLVLTNGGLARAGDYIIIGEYDVATSNSIVVDGGLLRVTNNAGAGVLDIRRGDCVLNAGLVDADTLRLTNVAGAFTFNGGVLAVKSTTSGVPLLVGDGVKSATLHLAGAGIHAFPGHPATAGVTVRSNATLTGGGIVQGRFVVAAGGTMSPGPAPGTLGNLTLADAVSPTLNGATIMEVSKSGAVSTNDNLQTLVTLSYGGVLTVTKLGPTALTPGDRFKLFTAPSYSGTFTALNLPPLGPGLSWTNRLLVDGSIEVIGALQPRLVGLTVAGPNVIITGTNGLAGTSYTVLTTTNAALPASSWVSLVTNQFGAAGGFGFTNPFTPLEPQRYFRLQTP
jgi:T5SS/PEP-CTERM-associated repeat protein